MITRCGRGWLGQDDAGSVGSMKGQDSGAGQLVSFGLDRPNHAEADLTHTPTQALRRASPAAHSAPGSWEVQKLLEKNSTYPWYNMQLNRGQATSTCQAQVGKANAPWRSEQLIHEAQSYSHGHQSSRRGRVLVGVITTVQGVNVEKPKLP
ncbi:hypothetical protein GGI42DRAFT_165326 [Trichoderma sp. SZMC 28013]